MRRKEAKKAPRSIICVGCEQALADQISREFNVSDQGIDMEG